LFQFFVRSLELNGLAGIIPSEMGRLTLLDYLNLGKYKKSDLPNLIRTKKKIGMLTIVGCMLIIVHVLQLKTA